MAEKDLNLLEQNLVKKNHILDELMGFANKQLELLDSPDMSAEAFDACMEEQDKQIQELITLNEEADMLYERLRSEDLSINERYVGQIGRLKALSSQITDKINCLQEKEQSNKRKLESYFQKERKNVGDGRRSSKAALDYYRSMNRSNIIPPQFMDQKK